MPFNSFRQWIVLSHRQPNFSWTNTNMEIYPLQTHCSLVENFCSSHEHSCEVIAPEKTLYLYLVEITRFSHMFSTKDRENWIYFSSHGVCIILSRCLRVAKPDEYVDGARNQKFLLSRDTNGPKVKRYEIKDKDFRGCEKTAHL